jgi:hypothetical protein
MYVYVYVYMCVMVGCESTHQIGASLDRQSKGAPGSCGEEVIFPAKPYPTGTHAAVLSMTWGAW